MKKAIKLFAIFIVLTIFSQVSVVALASEKSSIIVAYDAVNKAITIDGTSNAPALSPVTVNVTLSENGVPSDSNTPVISGMFFAGTDGRLTYSAPLAEDFPAGKYNVYVGMMHLENAYVATVMVFDKNSQETADVIELINDVKSASEMTEVVTEGASALGIDKDTVEDMGAVCKTIYGIMKAEGDFDYETFDRAFKMGLAACLLKDGESVDTVMNKYAAVFNTDYDTYASLDEDVKKAFDNIIKNVDMSEGFVDFEETELLASLVASKTNDEFKSIISENEEFFGVDTDGDFEDLSVNNRAKVYKTIFGERKDFLTPEDVGKAFDKAVDKIAKEAEDKKSSGGSGGGGSSSGGNSFSVAIPDTNPPFTAPEVQNPVSKYSDINGHFAESAINTLSDMGIINGFEDSTFRPNDSVTRAQLAKMTVSALKISQGADVKTFGDVTSSEWYYECINILSSKNIVSGDGANFYPNNLVTRQDAAVILYRALATVGKNMNGTFNFADMDTVSEYAKEAVGAMASNGIILGDASGFRPLSNLTRGEAAVLISRIINAN
ncbi:MAG: S-layer homology domain-containing protein [Clostridia bacterium]|nr:S-layer homology domain-containing protein [Clostridia bacterium]